MVSLRCNGQLVNLGFFATAEEALCVARPPEGQAAAQWAAAAPVPLTSEEARQQAKAENLTLLLADNKTGYFGVYHQPSRPNPYKAELRRGGKVVYLGSFATTEEAALCVARSPEGQAAAEEKAAAAPVPLTSEEARQQAQAEGLTLSLADSPVGYFGVHHKPGRAKPYLAQVRRGGTTVHLGSFATAEEAALCIARSPEGRAVAAAAAERAAAPPPLTSEEARQQAQAEGLTLLKADNNSGYFGVSLTHPGQPKPYLARVSRGGKRVNLGYFITAEEAALCVARIPEVAAAPPLTAKEAQQRLRDAIIGAVALDIIYEAAGAATAELSAEVAAEVMAGIAMGL